MVAPWRLVGLSLLGLAGVGLFFWGMAYPLGYGPVNSAIVAGAIALFGLWELVLEDTSF
jgi:hypothetical protein